MTNRLDHDHDLDRHLRRTLAAVAATVDAQPEPARPRRRSRRRLVLGAGIAIAAVPLAAGAWVQFGPEYVDRIPPANPILSGSLDGERYWVVDGRPNRRCEDAPSGIELIVEEQNLVGQEWNTTGATFGRMNPDGCVAGAGVPADTYDADGGVTVGGGMLWMGALHPDVDQVRVTLGGGEPFDADIVEHEGGTYFLLEVPPGTGSFAIDYVAHGVVVPPPAGDSRDHLVPAG